MNNNLQALDAGRIVAAIVTGGISELHNFSMQIVEDSIQVGNAILSEDSHLGQTINRIGDMFNNTINARIKELLEKLVADFEAYQAATIQNENAAMEETNMAAKAFDEISAGILSIMGQK